MNLVKCTLLTSSLIVISCGSNYRHPESIESKMARYKSQKENENIVPDLEILSADIQFKYPGQRSKRSSRSRAPASSADGGASWDLGQDNGPSNKKLYFLTLLSQYQQLNTLIPDQKAPEVKHCPNFHTNLLNHKEQNGGYAPLASRYKYGSFTDDTVALYPELALPMGLDGKRPRVVDIMKNPEKKSTYGGDKAIVEKALSLHLSKTYKELRELCQYGSSDNYYIWENLVTHIKRNKRGFPANKENMSTLLKTTIFTNRALILSYGHRNRNRNSRTPASIKSTSTYHDMVLRRLNVKWSESYFYAIKKIRGQ
jgi:hypothetical protein